MRNRIITALFPLIALGAAPGLEARGATPAGITTLRQVQVSNGSQIDLLFDGKVSRGQVKTEFFNDIIQLSLTDVAVYPAKISSVNSGSLAKIFAYQYAPKLVRCRLTVRGKAEQFKDKLQLSANGKILTVRIAGEGADRQDEITVQASAPQRSQAGTAGDRSPLATGNAAGAQAAQPAVAEPATGDAVERIARDANEKALLDRVMSAPIQQAKADAKAEKAEKAEPRPEPRKAVGGARPLPSFAGMLAKLAAVLALFGAVAFALRKVLSAKGSTGVMGAINRYAKKKEKMIEVLSTHHLGPKKNIAVVRVCGRTMVLGVSNESINLIAQLEEGDDPSLMDLDDLSGPALGMALGSGDRSAKRAAPPMASGAGATAAGPAIFADLLKSESARPSLAPTPASTQTAPQPAPAQKAANPQSAGTGMAGASYRAQIRSRLEGLKTL